MNEKKDTIVYRLVDGDPDCFESTVYIDIGSPKNTHLQEKEHRIEGKEFVTLVVVSKRLARHQAYNLKVLDLKEYYTRFGDLPLYNRNDYTYQKIGVASVISHRDS